MTIFSYLETSTDDWTVFLARYDIEDSRRELLGTGSLFTKPNDKDIMLGFSSLAPYFAKSVENRDGTLLIFDSEGRGFLERGFNREGNLIELLP